MTERVDDPAEHAPEDPERARIRRMLLERGVLPIHVTEKLIDFWIIQDAKDQEEGRRMGCRPPNRLFFGGGG